MGQLIDGVWHAGWYAPDKKGAFERPATVFRGTPPAIEAGRYHLYASYACPWAHRTLITRALRGLGDAIGVTIVDPHMGEDGWEFRDEPDPFGGAKYLREIYLRANPRYTGRVTVPVLWDRLENTVVNNESREIMRMLDVNFDSLASGPSLAPASLRSQIEEILDAIYTPINNGVYRAGFATTQSAYDDAVAALFAALSRWDAVLQRQPYLCGDSLTEADIALFTTLLRFDLVYYNHFKCNWRSLREHPGLWRFTRRLYQHPLIQPTCNLAHIKTHYYWSQTAVNPTRIVPVGPDLEQHLLEPV